MGYNVFACQRFMSASIDLTLAHGERVYRMERVCMCVSVCVCAGEGDEEGCYCSYTMLSLMGSRMIQIIFSG